MDTFEPNVVDKIKHTFVLLPIVHYGNSLVVRMSLLTFYFSMKEAKGPMA